MSWDYSALFVIFSSVSGELKDLSGEVLKNGSKVNWGTCSDSLGPSSSLQVSGNSSDWELESSLSRS